MTTDNPADTNVQPVTAQTINGSQNDNAQGGGQAPVQPASQPPEKTLTQAEVDQIVKDRLARERQKAAEKYADYDDLKARAEKLREYEDAQKSEMDKLTERLAGLEKERDATRAEAEQARQEAQAMLIKSALIAEAGKAGAIRPEDAYLLTDLSTITLGEDGAVIGAEEAVKTLIESGRLPLVGKPKAPSLDSGAGGGQPAQDKALKLTDEELAIAQKMGVKPEDYQKFKRS